MESHVPLQKFQQTYSIRSEQDPDPIFFLNEDKSAWILLRPGQFRGLGLLEKAREMADFMRFARIENNFPQD
jgi:hypothetical protein